MNCNKNFCDHFLSFLFFFFFFSLASLKMSCCAIFLFYLTFGNGSMKNKAVEETQAYYYTL